MIKITKLFLFVSLFIFFLPQFSFSQHVDRDRETPENDEPELAWKQDFLRTLDPSLGYPPVERRLAANQFVNKFFRQQAREQAAISGVNWTERGPSNVGGRTRAIMFDPNDGNHKKVWAGGVTGGLWYNNDISSPTSSWISVNDFWKNISITCITSDPNNSMVFYVGTGEGYTSATRGAGIWKTIDGGSTWSQLDASADFYFINDISIRNESANSVLYVAVDASYNNGVYHGVSKEGLQRSTDGGVTFTQVLPQASGHSYSPSDIEIGADNRIYIGTNRNVYGDGGGTILFSDNGISWTIINTYSGIAGVGRVELACAPSDANTLYGVIEANNICERMVRSQNKGISFFDRMEPADADAGVPPTDFTRGQAWYDLTLAVDPNNATIVFVGGIDIFKSADGGATWGQVSKWSNNSGLRNLTCSVVHSDQHAIVFVPGNSSKVIFGNDGGVYYTDNFSQAQTSDVISSRNKDYKVTQFYSCAVNPSFGSNNFLAGAQDNGTQRFTTSGMNSTQDVTGGDGAYCFIDEDNANVQIASYVRNNFYLSTDGGLSFNVTLSANNDGSFINPADYDSRENILFSGKDNTSIQRISDVTGSHTETVVNIAMGSTATHFRVSPYSVQGTSTVFIGTANGHVFKVTNAQATPTVVDISNTLPLGSISCIEIGATEMDLFVSYFNYGIVSIWQTSDGGAHWISKEGNLPDMPVRWTLVNPKNRNQVLLATEVGVWSTNDISIATPDWQPTNQGLGNVRVDMLKYRKSDNFVVVATYGRGLFSTDVFAAPNADFTASTSITYVNKNINFTDASSMATTWSWSFGTDATPALESTQGPHSVSYSSPGLKTVSLIINNGVSSKTITNFIRVLPDAVMPYLPANGGDFETNIDDFATENVSGTFFERGISSISGKNGVTSGTNAWVTGLTANNYLNLSQSILYSPNFNFSIASSYAIQFKTKFSFEPNYDGFIVEYTTDKGSSWTKLGTSGATWYNSITAADADPNLFSTNAPFFSGSTSGFETKICDVSILAGNSNVAFRFVYKSDPAVTSAGAAIDDFKITGPAPSPVTFVNANPGLSMCFNTGQASINSLLTVSDVTAGETLSWSASSAQNGTVGNLTFVATSTGNNITPTGNLFYLPNDGFIGIDSFKVYITNGASFDTITVHAIVNALPTVSISGNFSIYTGNSTILTAHGGLSYVWEPGTILTSTINVSSAGTISVTATDGNNCSSSTFATITEIDTCNNPIGSASNIFSMTSNRNNSLIVDNTLNTIVFIHRNNASIFGGHNGQLRYDISTDGGSTWIKDQGLLNPNSVNGINGARYPQVSFYNPDGNRDFKKARLVYYGSTVNGSSNIWNGYVSGMYKLDGLYHSESYNQATGTNTLIPGGLCKGASGAYWTIDAIYDGTRYSGFRILKGTRQDTVIYWSVNSTLSPSFNTTYSGKPMVTDWNIAFDSTGTFGWAVLLTHLTGGPTAYQYYPVFFKTTDGGISWIGPIQVNLNQFPNILARIPPETFPAAAFQVDLAVDFNGNPHAIMDIGSGDGTNYNIQPSAWHAMFDITYTDFGWMANNIADVQTFSALVGNGGQRLIHDTEPKIAKTNNGKKIVFTWVDSDSGNTGVGNNIAPNLKTRGYNVVTGKWTCVKDYVPNCSSSLLINNMPFTSVSPIILETSGKYKIPIVLAGLNASGSEADPAQFYYLNNVSYIESDFSISPPEIVLNGLSTFCNGDSATINAGAGYTSYLWSNGASSESIRVKKSGNYSVKITDSRSCSSVSSAKTIMVNALPSVTISGNTSICSGSSSTLTGKGGVSYVWLPTGLTTSTISLTTSGTLTLTAIDANSCRNSNIITVTVKAIPSVIIGGELSICNGSSSILTAYGGDSYIWQPEGITSSTIAVNTAQKITLIATNSNNCHNLIEQDVIVKDIPSPFITGNLTICKDSSSILTANGGVNYLWQPGDISSSTFTVYSAEILTLTASNINNCKSSINLLVSVNPVPTAGIIGKENIWPGKTGTLTATGGENFIWEPGLITTSTIAINSSGTYTLTVRDANNCKNSTVKEIGISSLPTVNVSASLSILCLGNSTILSALGGDLYSWSSEIGINTVSGARLNASPTVTSTYTVIALNVSTGCTTINTKIIHVEAGMPIITANNVTVCNGNPAPMLAGGADNFSWLPPTGLNNVTGPSVIATINSTTSYSITGINSCGAGLKIVTVTIKALPTLGISGNETVCIGNSVTLSAYGADTYIWSTNGSSSPTITESPTSSTTYSLTGTINGCSKMVTKTVTISTCSGIEEAFLNNSLSIYPNPTNGNIVLTFTLNNPNSILIKLRDVRGQLIYSDEKPKYSGTYIANISLGEFSKGIYFLAITSDFGVATRKVVLQ